MITITTLSDKNYLLKGIALYESLIETTKGKFTLHYLCLDDFTYDKLYELKLPHLIPHKIIKYENDKDFKTLISNTKYIENGFCSYCFALASFFTNDIMESLKTKGVFYIDSDIILYEDIEKIINSHKNKSVGIHLHKHVPIGHHVGGYNVGVIYFKNNDIGRNVLKWWRDCVLDIKNKWYVPYGRVGDQAYLEAFEPLFGKENIFVFDDEIGHAAPWNFNMITHLGNRGMVWNGEKQLIHFIHFSQFTPNFKNNSYNIDRDGGKTWGISQLNNVHIKEFYDDYYNRLKNVKIKYKLI
jgi:hypothetical protein